MIRRMITDVFPHSIHSGASASVIRSAFAVHVVQTERTRCLAKKFDMSDINTSAKNTMQISRDKIRLSPSFSLIYTEVSARMCMYVCVCIYI